MRIVVVVCLLALVGTARADNKELARDAYREGARQYDLGNFKDALESFKKAYLSYEDPALLYNIAQCYRQLGDKAEALRSYRVFLHKVHGSAQRAEVEKIVTELEAAIDQDRTAKAQPPTGTAEPSITPTPAAPPPSSPGAPVAPESATSSPVATPQIIATPPPKKPLGKKAWFWGLVAGGAVLVVGAVTAGVVVGTRGHNYLELTY